MPAEKDLCHLLQHLIHECSKVDANIDLKQFDDIVQSSKSLDTLIQHITYLFKAYTTKVDLLLRESRTTEDYCQLQKVLQSQEAEIRNHIRVHWNTIQLEQQMKLYAESVQLKLDQTERSKTDVQNQLKATIQSLKKDNDKLLEECRLLRDRDLNTVPSNYDTNHKTNKVYLNRYDTENKRAITKQKLNSSANFLKYSQALLQDLSKVVLQEDINRSTSRQDFSRKQFSKINSIQLLSKKGSINGKR